MTTKEFNYKNLSYQEIEKLPKTTQHALSQKKLSKELQERSPKLNSEPRDWSVGIENPVIFGVLEEPLQSIHHLIISPQKGSIHILGYFPEGPESVEIFTTKEKLDSFIAALTQAGDAAFNE
jgi:hypothetical protein